jgi:FdhE protein
MTDNWARRIRRADELASSNDDSATLLRFYVKLLRVQEEIYDALGAPASSPVSGSLDRDLPALRPHLPKLLQLAASSGPDPLASESRRLRDAGGAHVDEMLQRFWRAPSDREFFAKALLQPYASRLADARIGPIDRGLPRAPNRCPFCAGGPQLSVLRGSDAESEGRSLTCSLCLTSWPFRRVVCANCGEENEPALGYFHSPAYDHVRIEACDTCHRYLKGIDLSRLGVAEPFVDEVAAAALDVWARERGYVKIELNLVGL